MLARKRKDFPIFGGGENDECPVCLSVIVAIGFTKGICPSCAVREIVALRRQIKRLTKRAADSPKAGEIPATRRVRKSKVIRPARGG
jgi:hypothetical protein